MSLRAVVHVGFVALLALSGCQPTTTPTSKDAPEDTGDTPETETTVPPDTADEPVPVDTGASDCDRSPEEEVTAPSAPRVEGCPPVFAPVPAVLASCTSTTETGSWREVVVYDAEGRRASSTVGDASVEQTTVWTHDPATGDPTSIAFSDDGELVRVSTYAHTYDALGRLLTTEVFENGVPTVLQAYTWGACGLERTDVTSADGTATTWVATTYFLDGTRVDADGQPSRSFYVDPRTGAPTEQWVGDEVALSRHDPATGWLLETTWNGLTSGWVTTSTYDAFGRRTREDTADRCGEDRSVETTWTCP
jgi:YD repeat-containing protein